MWSLPKEERAQLVINGPTCVCVDYYTIFSKSCTFTREYCHKYEQTPFLLNHGEDLWVNGLQMIWIVKMVNGPFCI